MSTSAVQNSGVALDNSTKQQARHQQQQAQQQQQPQQSQSQLSSISIMWDYDIDNTLNSIKENCQTKIYKTKEQPLIPPSPSPTPSPSPPPPLARQERNVQEEVAKTTTQTMAAHAVDNTSRNSTIIMNSNSSQNLQPLTVKCDDVIKAVLPLTPPATPVTQNTARKRWKILAKVLRKDSEETVSSSGEECAAEQNASVRRFKSFDLLRQDSFEDHSTLNYLGKAENWYKYKVILDTGSSGTAQQEYTVNIHHMDRHLTATDLMGFNNTGNICVWPSEEALTAFVLSDLESYNGKWILELGGGFTCLSGLMLSKYAKPYAVHLTDGNEVSVENVKKTVCLNEMSCYTKCSVLKWEERGSRSPSEAGKFDVILSADCLFFDEARSALVDTIWYYLSQHGEALVMAPRRGKTMSLFIEESVKHGFMVSITQRYNETIWKRHLELMNSTLYDADLHYPVLLRLRKPPMERNGNAANMSLAVPMDVCKEDDDNEDS
ncbi:calmodulin-lysine N-methyltransferase [Musca domestica]|uniref:Calmodulin-lysine N-methyltransferase n=1 Tax=Musca domestica TaxID=7370 RepID=A0A1I8NII1_MUSDO|nr:calmodulin-lysine N-methyltransferase [Musca domestica]